MVKQTYMAPSDVPPMSTAVTKAENPFVFVFRAVFGLDARI